MAGFNIYKWNFSGSRCPNCSWPDCDKPIGVFQCIGCGKIVCSEHTEKHRKPLRARLETLIDKLDRLNYSGSTTAEFDDILGQKKVLETAFIQKKDEINRWERTAIAEITDAACRAQAKVDQLYQSHLTFLEKHEKLMQSHATPLHSNLLSIMKKAELDDGFHEGHLKRWSQLIDSRPVVQQPTKINKNMANFALLEYRTPFIEKLCVEGENPVWEPPPSPVDPLYGMVPSMYPRVFPSNKGEFSSGVHRFRFRSECAFFGVSSNPGDLEKRPDSIPLTYGWTGDNLVYVDGNPVARYNRYQSDMRMGDTFALVVDCDQRTLSLTNERTNQTHELKVDRTTCPLPWLLNVRFLSMVDEDSFHED